MSPEREPDIRKLQQALNLFLKEVRPRFNVEGCSDAIIVTLSKLITFKYFAGWLWPPVHQTNHRFRLKLVGETVLKQEETFPEVQAHESDEDLGLTLHHSLKSLRSDAAGRRILEEHGCRAAVEIHFAYYGRPILWLNLGLPDAKVIQAVETQDLLLVFCRCCLVSLHGAYLTEISRQEGKKEAPAEIDDRFDLPIHWLHSVIRHMNIALLRLQNGEAEDAEEALQRASIMSGVCLAELIELTDHLRSSQEPQDRSDPALEMSDDPTKA